MEINLFDIIQARKLSVLARLTKTLDVASKMLLFHTYILSQFEYCSLVWHFCSRDKMKKIEKIQKQALRYIFNDLMLAIVNCLRKLIDR